MERLIKNCSWEIAIILCIRDCGGDLVDLQRIYQTLERYRDLTKEDQEIIYGQPRYTHFVRSNLAKLKKWGIAEQKGRGMYCLTPLGEKLMPLIEKGISIERIYTALREERKNEKG